ncbi:MAG TPA: methylmalonyl-CoA mutase family protein [Terracidiphilus sp.]|jgi:methylmalonyl-CoA mutase|nr:methylmalonyl-CoA mutase family protein [Terracidiphilus sp.]
MASGSFLSDFLPVPTADWEHAVRETVGGPEYAAKLIWHPEEGLSVKPYYRAEDIQGLQFLKAAVGEFPYVRNNRASADWRIREAVEIAAPEKANQAAIEAIGAGAEEIAFDGALIESEGDLARLLGSLEQIPVRIHGLNPRTARITADYLLAHRHTAEISAAIDPLADLDFSAELLCSPPDWRPFTISADDYEERGVGAIEQVAFVLSAGVEFLDAILGRGVDISLVTKALGFSFAIGPQFLVEIAKLRAFRLAWARIVESFGGDVESAKPVVYSRTARWNETVYDPHVNLLRATTAAMSAILGGTDSLEVAPYDECYQKPGQASRRLARNLQLILKHEAEFARVADPLGGSYVVEVLTNSIATKAWKTFQELEAAGGFRKAKADGTIRSIVERRAADRDASARLRRLVLTGINRFANPNEKAADRVDPNQWNRSQRAARDFEELRFRTERAADRGKLPTILFAEFGDAKMRSVRSHFSAEFLACAGLTGDTRYFERPPELADAKADLILLCSSDPEYMSFTDKLMPLLAQRNSSAQVVIVGNPENAEQLKRIGVSEFIHLRSDAVGVLTSLQQKLGIEG